MTASLEAPFRRASPVDAQALATRCGYRLRAERGMVKGGWRGDGTSWLLLVKPR